MPKMNRQLVLFCGIFIGAVATVAGFFLADWVSAPRWSRR